MLPPPTLSFTIPSVHDGLVLHCRVYHPTCLAPKSVSQVSGWRKRAAIVAHPYAPLGGCYDDPVVCAVASTILREGFIVGTFNFRGTGDSQGRTSWQSKPEQNDYTSFIGFMVYYLHHIQPPSLPAGLQSLEGTQLNQEIHPLSPITSQVVSPPNPSSPENTNTQPLLLLSGYSYGAMITTSLPPIIASTMSPFQTPATGSPHAEIRQRATFLAGQQTKLMNERLSSLLSEHPAQGQNTQAVRIGGHEDLRKSSHENQHHPQVRRSIDRVRTLAASTPFGHKNPDTTNPPSHDPNPTSPTALEPIPDIATHLRTAYLLISPLQGLIHSLASMSLFSRNSKHRPSSDTHTPALSAQDTKLTIDPTLALFGDDDVFVSIHKLRAWAARLRAASAGRGDQLPRFRYREVAGAGHFWHDREAGRVLREEVGRFVSSL